MYFFRHGVLIVTILLTFKTNQSDGLIEEVLDIFSLTKSVFMGVLKTWDIIEEAHNVEDVQFPIIREKEKRVLSRLKDVQNQIISTEQQHVHTARWSTETIKEYMHKNYRIEGFLHQMNDIMNGIQTRSKLMKQYADNRDKLENSTLIDFAEWTVKPGENSIAFLMEKLHLICFGFKDRRGHNNSLLKLLTESLKDAREQVCSTQQSAQQFLFSLYSDIALTELKGYIMMQFSWMILRIYEQGNFTYEATLMRNSFYERIQKTQALLREVMKRADRNVWTCDPNLFVKGESFEEITRLLQGYIENEVDMNPDETCRENCAHYTITQNHGCFKDLYCSRQPRCTGKLLNCQYVDSDMWVCPASTKSDRRYEYIEYENGRILGVKGTCHRGTSKVDSWWRWLFWHCSYCFCLCDEQGVKSDRYFNLRESVSDINSNMIVTGIRFKKHNRIIHLQIQEGRLQENGVITPSSVTWKPVSDYRIYDRLVENGKDYHTLSWDRRAIDLDDLSSNSTNQVVTGVRFRVIGTHLNLEIRLTDYNFESGFLQNPSTTSVWISNDNTDFSKDKRTAITLTRPDVSTRSIVKSAFTSKHNQYIEFSNTDMDKDVAQTTVPFIDTQDVVSHPPVPLAGIGIYHKGASGYGGFIAPRIITYDFSSHIQIPDVNKSL